MNCPTCGSDEPRFLRGECIESWLANSGPDPWLANSGPDPWHGAPWAAPTPEPPK